MTLNAPPPEKQLVNTTKEAGHKAEEGHAENMTIGMDVPCQETDISMLETEAPSTIELETSRTPTDGQSEAVKKTNRENERYNSREYEAKQL